MRRPIAQPRSAVVVGAGMVGLATAWHLRRAGLEVTVLEKDRVAAGSSWGNAGWLTPPITTPLPEPAILRTGLAALFSPNSPLYVPLRPDLDLLRFLVGFGLHSTARAWKRTMAAYVPLNSASLAAFDELAAGGVAEPTHATADFLACFAGPGQHRLLLDEFTHIRAAGQPVEAQLLTGTEARALAPLLSPAVTSAIRLGGTRFLHPPRYLRALAEEAMACGVRLREGVTVTALDGGTPARAATLRTVDASGQEDVLAADVVVLATGAWLGRLARPFGVRMVVQAGRGYSFTVPADPMPRMPLYFPMQRVACTPLGDRFRVAGMMEFRKPGDRLDPRRIQAIVRAVRPLLSGANLDQREDEWVGSRPCTPDGLPLVGPTRSPRVIAAGGHGMWGITLGPLTGRLVTELVTTGQVPPSLSPLNPLR